MKFIFAVVLMSLTVSAFAVEKEIRCKGMVWKNNWANSVALRNISVARSGLIGELDGFKFVAGRNMATGAIGLEIEDMKSKVRTWSAAPMIEKGQEAGHALAVGDITVRLICHRI